MKRMLKGFTLVEIMIVVAIIAILAAVAIPNFIKYRRSSQATACVSNLKQIQAAKEQALMAGKTTLDAATLYGSTLPILPFRVTIQPSPGLSSYMPLRMKSFTWTWNAYGAAIGTACSDGSSAHRKLPISISQP